MVFNQYPYLNVNDLNLDYILKQIKVMMNEVTNFVSINAIKYADPIQWDITRQYEKNTVVIDPLTGTAYISVAPVPTGVSLTRPEYWTVVFDLGSFVTRAAQNFTSRWESETTLTATFATNTGEWLVWGDVLYKALVPITAGDQYVIGSNIDHFTIEDLYNAYLNTIASILGMIGDLVDLNTSDTSDIVHAINSVLSDLNSAFSDLNNTIGDLQDLNTSDKSSIVNAINENTDAITNINDNRFYITPEMYGAVGDGVTDDTAAMQDAIDACISLGKSLKLATKTYLVTAPLNIYGGIKIEGTTSAHIFVDTFPNSTIKADFNALSTDPVLNISENAANYSSDTSTLVDEILLRDFNIDGDGAFCGIKCEIRNSSIENVTIQYCAIGVYLNRVYTTYIKRLACLFCDVGVWCRKVNANASISDSWLTYGGGILNDDDMDTRITSLLVPDQSKKTALYLLNSAISVFNTTFEAYYYGCFACRGSSLFADDLHVEQIVTGGACFHDDPVANVNYFKITNASFYNSALYGGSIAVAGYRSMYDIESNFAKPANFIDPTLATRGSFRYRCRNYEMYLPISITNIVNPTITENHTHFNENGNLVIDFVLEDYDSYNSGYCLIKPASLDNNGYSGNTGFGYFMGNDLKCNLTNLAIVTLGGSSTAPDKQKRYFLTVPYTPA